MSLAEPRSQADRLRILERDGYRCAGCGVVHRRDPEQLVLDHVQERRDNGPNHDGNYQLLCKARCNPAKTERERRRLEAGAVAQRDRRTGRFGMKLTGAVMAVVGGGLLLRVSPSRLGLALAAVVLVVLAVRDRAVHQSRRRAMRERLDVKLAPLTCEPRDGRHVVGGSWSGWFWPSPGSLVIPVSPFVDTDDQEWTANVLRLAGQVAGHRFGHPAAARGELLCWELGDDEPDWVPEPKAGPAGPAGAAPRTDRFSEAVASLVGKGATIHQLSASRVRIEDLPGAFKAHRDEDRLGLVETVNAHLGGRWAPVWNVADGWVEFTKRPPLPKVVERPRYNPEVDDRLRLPFGVEERGGEVLWDTRTVPHSLWTGRTGLGKTVTLRTLIDGALERSWDVHLLDPKRLEFAAYRLRGVAVATEVEDMAAEIGAVWQLMEDRYRELADDPDAIEAMVPVLLVVDEAWEAVSRLNEQARGGRTSRSIEHEAVGQLRSIIRLGRAARCHVALGIQRPDAAILGGEARDNFGLRASVGPASPEAARMVHGRADVGRDLPPDDPGRMTVDLGDGPLEVRGYITHGVK